MDSMKEFFIDYNSHKIVGDTIGDTEKGTILFLHGAGKSNRKRYETLRRLLYEKGFSSCAFDFLGHGETGGPLSESSLQERTKQVYRVIEHIKTNGPLSIVGASMSGYTAVKLLELYDVKNLVLFVPAAYDKDAYYLPFDNRFTECIRREKSYLNSDAFDILGNYNGKLLIVSAENDTVIPNEVIENYYESALNAAKRRLITLKGSSHAILGFMDENKEQQQNLVNAMVEILR